MISDFITGFHIVHSSFGDFFTPLSSLYAVFVTALAVWTIFPPSRKVKKAPEEPHMLPYLVPYVGHVFSLLFDYTSTIARGRKYLNNTCEPFYLHLKGIKTCLITSPDDANTVNKSHHDFPRTPFLLKVSQSFGISKRGMELLRGSPVHQQTRDRPKQGSVIESALQIVHILMTPKPSNDPLKEKFLTHVSEFTKQDNLPLNAHIAMDEDTVWLSLMAWIRESFSATSAKSLFGEAIFRFDPHFLDHVLQFDDKSWMLFAEIPRPWSSSMWTAKKNIMKTMSQYFQLPQSERADASDMVKNMEAVLYENGLSVQDTATFITLVYSSSFTNAWKACYWTLSNMIHDPSLLAAIRTEISSVPTTPDNAIAYANALNKCPILVSLFNETLRTSAATGSWREASKNNIVGGKTIPKGTPVLVPYRDILMDRGAFGDDAPAFRWDRFQRDENLVNHANFRPWGGGAGICPGRFVAQAEILMFVALVVKRYEIERAEPEEAAPRVNADMPSAGIMGPVGNKDVIMRLKPMGA